MTSIGGIVVLLVYPYAQSLSFAIRKTLIFSPVVWVEVWFQANDTCLFRGPLCHHPGLFRALNGIFGKVGLKTSPVVLCSLINSFCTPILLYAAESLDFNNRSLRSMENAYSQAFFKIFNTYDKNIFKQCQFYMGYLPMCVLIDLRKLNFLHNIVFQDISSRTLTYHLAKWTDCDFEVLRNKYRIPDGSKMNYYKHWLSKFFESSLNL